MHPAHMKCDICWFNAKGDYTQDILLCLDCVITCDACTKCFCPQHWRSWQTTEKCIECNDSVCKDCRLYLHGSVYCWPCTENHTPPDRFTIDWVPDLKMMPQHRKWDQNRRTPFFLIPLPPTLTSPRRRHRAFYHCKRSAEVEEKEYKASPPSETKPPYLEKVTQRPIPPKEANVQLSNPFTTYVPNFDDEDYNDYVFTSSDEETTKNSQNMSLTF